MCSGNPFRLAHILDYVQGNSVMAEAEIIKEAKKKSRKAQTWLYENYKNTWYAICLRYCREVNDASDVLQNALVKIFTKMKQFDPDKGQLKSWSSKIVVNENLMHLRKTVDSFQMSDIQDEFHLEDTSETPLDRLSAKELSALIRALPKGYRTVFNLYVLDGYNHREIAVMLNISEGTSKSQLFKARKMLQEKLEVLI